MFHADGEYPGGDARFFDRGAVIREIERGTADHRGELAWFMLRHRLCDQTEREVRISTAKEGDAGPFTLKIETRSKSGKDFGIGPRQIQEFWRFIRKLAICATTGKILHLIYGADC
jgi:hypothetical protein